MSADLVVADIGTIYASTLRNTDDNTVIDLTNKVVTLCFRINDGPTTRRTMTVETPATAGNVKYSFSAGDLVEPGILMAEIEISGNTASVTIDGTNDKIDGADDIDGVVPATNVHATYSSGAVLAAAIIAVLTAALPSSNWANAITYDTGTQLFKVTTDSIQQFFFLSGPNTAASIHRALGLPTSDVGRSSVLIGTTPIPFASIVLTSRDPKQYIVRARV